MMSIAEGESERERVVVCARQSVSNRAQETVNDAGPPGSGGGGGGW
jgi:hypothetical protein